MTIQSLSYSAIQSLEPQTVRGYDCDGVVDGRPVKVRQNRYGAVIPTVGSTLLTTYGKGVVKGYDRGSLRVAITEFNEDYVFETKDTENPDILDASECVKQLSEVRNRAIEGHIRDVVRIHASEISGNLPKEWQEHVDNIEWFKPNEFVMDLTPKSYVPASTECLVEVIVTERETKAEREKRRALEVKQALKLRRDLLAAYDDDQCPDDIADEIAAEFGDND